MKNRHQVFIGLLVLPLLICACSKAESFFSSSRNYQVIFENNPNVTNEEIFSKGFSIGKVLSQDINTDNLVVITISVAKDKADLIRTNTVFYAADGALIYETVEDMWGIPLPENAKILGFPSKTSLVMFETQAKARKLAGNVKETTGAWYDLAIEKSNEWYKKIQ